MGLLHPKEGTVRNNIVDCSGFYTTVPSWGRSSPGCNATADDSVRCDAIKQFAYHQAKKRCSTVLSSQHPHPPDGHHATPSFSEADAPDVLRGVRVHPNFEFGELIWIKACWRQLLHTQGTTKVRSVFSVAGLRSSKPSTLTAHFSHSPSRCAVASTVERLAHRCKSARERNHDASG